MNRVKATNNLLITNQIYKSKYNILCNLITKIKETYKLERYTINMQRTSEKISDHSLIQKKLN